MKKGSRILAIIAGMALTCYCGSQEKSPQQQGVDALTTAQAPTPPATVQPQTLPPPVQPQTPPATVQAPSPPVTVQPPIPTATVQPPTPSATAQAPTPLATAQAPTPSATAQAPTPPTVVILRGNPMGAVKYPHAAHARLVGGGCDQCHHASKPEKPLESRYQKCQDCHTKAATSPMKTKAPGAFHDPMAKKGVCVDCHLKENAAGKKAPVKCPDCHKKENAGRAATGPLAHTFSIVARDPATGDLGVAVQSHWFSVGSIVTWAEAGVGAIATQSFVEPAYGPRGLELIRNGTPAPDALKRLVAEDAQREVRQVAMIDTQGRVAAHTGKLAIAAAGHKVGAQYSVQANLMANDRVWPAMSAAYEGAKGDLADRLLAALEAGQKAGGDIRGKQSAAILVVKAKSSGKPWAGADRLFDLRVEDHPDPIVELRRLIRLQRAYAHANRGDELVADKKIEAALKEYAEAGRLAPEILELPFWQAVTMASIGRISEAEPIFRRVFAKEPYWADLVPRLPAAGQLPDDKALIARIVGLKPAR